MPLIATLRHETSVPIRLPSQAPSLSRGCYSALPPANSYGLKTRGKEAGVTLHRYQIALECSPVPVPPDDPSLDRPPASTQFGYLGDLSGSDAAPETPGPPFQQMVDRSPAQARQSVPLPNGITVQRYQQLHRDGATWTAGRWRYFVWSDPAEAHSALAMAAQLASLVEADPPVSATTAGWVTEFQGPGRSYTTVTWQAGQDWYQVQRQDDPAAEIAMARAMAPVASGG